MPEIKWMHQCIKQNILYCKRITLWQHIDFDICTYFNIYYNITVDNSIAIAHIKAFPWEGAWEKILQMAGRRCALWGFPVCQHGFLPVYFTTWKWVVLFLTLKCSYSHNTHYNIVIYQFLIPYLLAHLPGTWTDIGHWHTMILFPQVCPIPGPCCSLLW